MDAHHIEMNVEGMTCTNCALTINRFLEKRGMTKVSVDFASGEVSFENESHIPIHEITEGIQSLGYTVKNEHAEKESWLKEQWEKLSTKFWISFAFTVPLVLHMILPFHLLHNPVFQLIMATPVFIIGCVYFGKSAYHSVLSGIPNMDVLIFIGSTAAYVYSFIGAIIMENEKYLFFETSATIITLVLLGNLIEHRSVQQTRSSLKELMNLQPAKAKLISFFGNPLFEVISEITSAEIKKGNYLLVNSGDKIPADAEVVWGSGTADESMLTGESIPVEKVLQNKVVGGTTLVSGSIKIKATAVGQDSALSRIIELVKSAQQNKPSIQKLADKITAWFVPAVLLISAVTFLLCFFAFNISFQHSLMNSIAVLVISCPCAMGLATPTAVMVGIGRSAKNGILIKGSQTLEIFSSIKQIVFDKTGTITTGKFKVKEIKGMEGKEEELKGIVTGLEKFSSHPIAVSLLNEFKETPPLHFKNIQEQKGLSVTGEDESGNRFEAGSYTVAKNLTTDSSHNIYVIKNEKLYGWIDIEDEIKPEAAAVISFLKSKGIKTIMLSGDREEPCKQVAGKVGVDAYFSQQMPEKKLEFISSLVKETPTAMVGDGINDAPALAKATIGISLSNATQVAVDSAQIILLNGNLNYLKEAFLISKHSMLTIKQNLFWAFFYNVLAIPVAAAGFLSPMIGAMSMAFSDVIVIGNSIRLRTKKLIS